MLNVMESFKAGQMKARILKLADKYGPRVRFTPDGSEETNSDATDKAIETAEKAENAEFDKMKQQSDQHQANATRSREQAQAANSSLETANAEKESLKQQLAEAESKLTRKDIGVKKINVEESADPEMAQAVNDLKEALASSNDEIKDLKKAKSKFEEDDANARQQNQANDARNAAYNELLSDLDADYGADNRNDAVAKFQVLAQAGDVPANSPAKAARLMEKCYRDAKADKDKKKKDDPLRTDNGSGGGSDVLKGHKLKKGSLDEVFDQVTTALG